MPIHRLVPASIRRRTPENLVNLYMYIRANTVLALKKFKVKACFWIDYDEVLEWFRNKNIFFILSIGRSGTRFLAELLNKSPNALVVHEPFDEAIPHQNAYLNPISAEKYIRDFRMKEIYLRVHNLDIDIYGEVNSYLRRHCKAIKKLIPNVKLIHLVRDGRDVVRSMYARMTMKPGVYSTRNIVPLEDDPWRSEWSRMSRFERLCWYWMIENKYLRECIDRFVRFEDIITDYNYFKRNVLDYINLNIPREVWEHEVNKPKNITIVHKLPHWSEWSSELMESFKRICGDEMKIYGYKLD